MKNLILILLMFVAGCCCDALQAQNQYQYNNYYYGNAGNSYVAVAEDSDGDGIIDIYDSDDDNDGIIDIYDPDDDNDGVLDVYEFGANGRLLGSQVYNFYQINQIRRPAYKPLPPQPYYNGCKFKKCQPYYGSSVAYGQGDQGEAAVQKGSGQLFCEKEVEMMAAQNSCNHIQSAPPGTFVGVGCTTGTGPAPTCEPRLPRLWIQTGDASVRRGNTTYRARIWKQKH